MTAALALQVDTRRRRGRALEWSPSELETLRSMYHDSGAPAVAALLGRTPRAVVCQAYRLGLRAGGHWKHWTRLEDRRLTMLWGEASLHAISKRLRRTRSSVYERARDIGLPTGCPQGMEFLSAAAARAGYSKQGLRALLDWDGVETRKLMARPQRALTYRRRIVDPDDVDSAVANWLAAEYVNEAATRLEIGWKTLVRWLEESGRKMPPRPGGKKRWRVPTATIDAVVAERRSARERRAA